LPGCAPHDRDVVTQDAKEAARTLNLFKRMLPKNLAALEI
jgi:hypothetical protein